MTIEDWWEEWNNPGGPDPADGWLVPASGGWDWTADSLMMGEYVGYPLYLKLRDRLCTLDVPVSTHDLLIQQLIDTHDVSALTDQGARATLVVWDRPGGIQPIEVWDATVFPALTG